MIGIALGKAPCIWPRARARERIEPQGSAIKCLVFYKETKLAILYQEPEAKPCHNTWKTIKRKGMLFIYLVTFILFERLRNRQTDLLSP